jgi:hypothetical protein
MKKTLLTVATLALLAGSTALVRAGDMDNMSGMNDKTNIPAAGTNAPIKPYPFSYCLTSGEKLGEMGKPITTNYLGQEIKFCCPDCVKDFKKDPDKYMKKLQAAEDKAAKK